MSFRFCSLAGELPGNATVLKTHQGAELSVLQTTKAPPATALNKVYKDRRATVHSSKTDHIDRDGAKCADSNLPDPMLMKLNCFLARTH